MDKIYIAKRGNSCTIYVDPVTSQPLVLSGPYDQPLGGLPVSCNLRNWQQALARAGVRGTFDPVFLEEKMPEPPSVIRTDKVIAETEQTLEQNRKLMKTTGQDVPNISHVGSPIVAEPIPSAIIQDDNRVLSEFKMLLGKYEVSIGKTKADLKIRVNAVANFILAVSPDLEIELNLLKESYQAPRFDIDG